MSRCNERGISRKQLHEKCDLSHTSDRRIDPHQLRASPTQDHKRNNNRIINNITGRDSNTTQNHTHASTPALNWRNSNAKKELMKEFAKPTSAIRNMSIKDIHASSPMYSGYKYANFHANVNRIAKHFDVKLPKNTQPTNSKESTKTKSKKKGKQPDWRTSQERRMLFKLLMEENSGLQDMTPLQIYDSHKGFQKWDLTKFEKYLSYLRAVADNEKEKIKFEEQAFQKETSAFPRNELTNRGYPFWGYHLADKLLRTDVKSGAADTLRPLDLRETRNEYKEFPSKVFLKHVHQEKRNQRESSYWNIKRKKDAERMKDKEAEEMKNDWEEEMVRFFEQCSIDK
jgi:hypothetical protein